MTHEFAKYPDDTLGVFSNIGKKETGEDISLHYFQIVEKWKAIHSSNIKFYC